MSQVSMGGIEKPEGETRKSGVLSRFWDALGILLCLVLAFCATLFPARNGDLFLNLAIGRQLVQGTYDFSKDGFVYTNPDTFVNHNWLFGALLYLIHEIHPTFGPSLLIILKALGAVGVLVLIGKSFRLPVGRLTIPVLVLGLAGLGLSNRWLLQPFAVSVFFFALTLFFLARLEPQDGEENTPGRLPYFALPLLFALWVNFDGWFLLGPLAVTIFCLGRIVSGNSRLTHTNLGLLIGLSWVACLANPWGYKALQIPFNLRFYDDSLAGWRELYPQWFGPALGGAYLRTTVGLTVNGMAFLPLALVGILFIISGRSKLAFSLIGVFLFFLVLGLGFSRTLPFFCVAGAWATIGLCLSKKTGLLQQENNRAIGKSKSDSAETLVFPKMGLCFLLVLGIVFAIPGWIHPRLAEERSFGLGILPDESLRGLCNWVKEKKDKGEWDESKNVFHLTLELSNYLAWYAPGTKGFIDYRLSPGKSGANDYYTIQKGLRKAASPEAGNAFQIDEWKEVLKNWNIGYLVFQEGVGRDSDGLALIYLLRGNRANLDILRVEGTTCAVSRKKPGEENKPKAEDPKSLAFGLEATKIEDPLPVKDPLFSVWKALFPETVRSSPKDYEAYLRLIQFLSSEKRGPFNWLNGQIALMAVSASSPQAMANPALWTSFCGTANGYTGNPIGMTMQNIGLQIIEDADPAYLYLSVRASRNALLSQPNDPKALMRLGQAYEQLNNQTLERLHFRVMTPMALIRRYQTLSALGKASRVSQSPEDLRGIHELLMQLYGQTYPDQTLVHMKDYLEIIKVYGLNRPPNEMEEIIKRLQVNLDGLAQEVQKRQDRFETESDRIEKQAPASSALEKIRLAYSDLGLLRTARELIGTPQSREQAALDSSGLIASQTALFNLEVMLNMGEADAAAEFLTEEFKDRLGPYPSLKIPSYEWLNVMIAASQGRYQDADSYLKECFQAAQRNINGYRGNLRDLALGLPKKDFFPKATPAEMASISLSRSIFAGTTPIQGFTGILSLPFDFHLNIPLIDFVGLNQALELCILQMESTNIASEFEVCRGFLRLEAGDPVGAKQSFKKAIEISPMTPSVFIVRKFLEKMP